MKLELKHLACYLPYELKMHQENLTGTKSYSWKLLPEHIDDALAFQNKPILRPLSDLTDEVLKEMFNDQDLDISRMKYAIVCNYQLMGEWFKETIVLRKVFNDDYAAFTMSGWLLMKLFENHLDVFGLIEKGLAIDINTLK